MKLTLKPTRILKVLLLIILFLLVANIIGIYSYFRYDSLYGDIVQFFDFDTEFNIPTYFSSVILLFSSVLLFLISRYHKNHGLTRVLWLFLSIIFLGLSMDEFMVIHERTSQIMRDNFNLSGALFYAWVIPYGIVALAVGLLFYFYILRKLPKRIRNLLILSGIVFLSGAVGVEMVSSALRVSHDEFDLTTAILYTVEETMEMLGISLFIYGLLSYLEVEVNVGLG